MTLCYGMAKLAAVAAGHEILAWDTLPLQSVGSF